MARSKQVISRGGPLTFGKYKGKTPEVIIGEGNIAYLAWLLKNKINPFDEVTENFVKSWAVQNKAQWEKIKVKEGVEVQEVDMSVEPTETNEERFFTKFAGISKERQAMWGSW